MSVNKVNIKNRKASFEYQFIDKFVAGIMLVGTEIKSIRNNKANISDAHCIFADNELYVKNLHISEYENGYRNHEPKREEDLIRVRNRLPERVNRREPGSGRRQRRPANRRRYHWATRRVP